MKDNTLEDYDVELALDWLRDNAEAIGQAKENAVMAEKMLAHMKAIAMKQSGESSVSAQEREAYASEDYVSAVVYMAKAAGRYETEKAKREAAALKIEVWRSASANYRSMKL
jgi:hypothetical protein